MQLIIMGIGHGAITKEEEARQHRPISSALRDISPARLLEQSEWRAAEAPQSVTRPMRIRSDVAIGAGENPTCS